MSSKERECHIVIITKTSDDGNLMKTSWPVSKHEVDRCTRIRLKASFTFY